MATRGAVREVIIADAPYEPLSDSLVNFVVCLLDSPLKSSARSQRRIRSFRKSFERAK